MKSELLSVLILDDEYLVRQLLKRSVDWDSLGLEVVAESQSAMEALDLVDEKRPHIIFADICMPMMDGIEFSRRVLEKYPQTIIIILTGHEEFEYARNCLKLGVSDFLLKPIDGKEITRVLEKARESIVSEKCRAEEYEKLKVQIRESFSCLRERLFNDLLLGTTDETSMGEKLEYYGIGFDSKSFQVSLLSPSFDDVASAQSEEDLLILRMKCLKEIVDYYLGTRCVYAFNGPLGNIVILSNDPLIDLSSLCDTIQSYLMERFQCALAVGVGGAKEGFEGLSLSYEEARKALEYTAVEGKNAVILYSDVNLSKESTEINLERLLRDFSFSLSAGLKERSEEIAFKVLSGCGGGDCRDIQSVRVFASNLISVILNTVMDGQIPIDAIFSREGKPYDAVFQISTLPEMKIYLSGLIADVSHRVNAVQSNRISTLVKNVSAFLESHFHNSDLSQTEVARHFNVNSSYLSRKFKQETGASFVEFLAKVRISKAIELLKSTDKLNYEVADEVGIADPHYFSIFFKRHMGMSISEYRKEIST